MADIEVTFVNPANNQELDVELDDAMTTPQVLQALIENNFIEPLSNATQSYRLDIKGKSSIAEGQTLAAAGARSRDRIAVVVAQRGGSK